MQQPQQAQAAERAASGAAANEAGAVMCAAEQQRQHEQQRQQDQLELQELLQRQQRWHTKAVAVEAAVGAAAAVGTRPSPAAAVAAGTVVSVGPASGDTDDPFRAGGEAAAGRTQAAAARAMVVGGDAETTLGHFGNAAAQRGPDQGADAVTVGSGLPVVTSRTRPRDAVEGCPGNTGHASVGGGGSGEGSTGMVTDHRDEPGDEDDVQGPAVQEMSHLREDMAI